LGTYSRKSARNDYAKRRQKRQRRRKVAFGVLVGVGALILAIIAAAIGFVLYLNSTLQSGYLADKAGIDAVTVERSGPSDPFWILLIGTDDRDDGAPMRSDTLVLARIDPQTKSAALVSIPRDTQVQIAGYGTCKINAAYAYGWAKDGVSGPQYAIQAVTNLTGVQVSGYAVVNFDGFKNVVNALGGVNVDVPASIIDDPDSGGIDIYAGQQVLDGDQALAFCRARECFSDGDYQRETDQRVFLTAMAQQVLAADPVTIINTVTQIAQMCDTNMDVSEIAQVANSMRGISATDIHTYMVPGTGGLQGGVWYQVTDTKDMNTLFSALNNGTYPDQQSSNEIGQYPSSYLPTDDSDSSSGSTSTDQSGGSGDSSVTPADYTVDVKNGWGYQGAASSVSDMLALAGYKQGVVGNANSMVYQQTFIIYQDDSDEAAANDIQSRMKCGKVMENAGRYSFTGDILVVIGKDFPNASSSSSN
jgi:LCP family protein required for cell wall assembly